MQLSLVLPRGWQLPAAMPVLMKEMRVRMRGVRAPAMLFLSTAAAITIGLVILGTQWGFYNAQILTVTSTIAAYSNQMADLGRHLMLGLMGMEMALCALITPALTAGAFSLEHEQQTLELLLLTPLSQPQYRARQVDRHSRVLGDVTQRCAHRRHHLSLRWGESLAIRAGTAAHSRHDSVFRRHRPVVLAAFSQNDGGHHPGLLPVPGLAVAAAHSLCLAPTESRSRRECRPRRRADQCDIAAAGHRAAFTRH